MDEKPKFKFEFTIDELNIIMAGLAELPFKTSQGMIQAISTQFNTQQKQPE